MALARRRASGGISLFPILAVLICTLGALIVLLMVVVQHAKSEARALAKRNAPATNASPAAYRPETIQDPALAAEKLKELSEAEEDAIWRGDLLREQREALAKKLAEQRLELSHLEEHIRRIEDQGDSLRKQAEELERLGEMSDEERSRSQAALAAAQAELEKARQDLEDAKREAAAKPKAYAIVPYEGPNGVHRRPIYVECTDLGVIIQPEGIVLEPRDFSGPLGPGNPLDAALLAIREYWTSHGLTKPGEAYPLMIVRPDGAVAYAVCRSAMKSWEDEFGYELIDGEMQVAYPGPDTALKKEVERAVADARQRQAVLAMAAPAGYRDRPGALRASSSGGFVARPEAGGNGGPGGGSGGGPGGKVAARARGSRGIGGGAGGMDGVGFAGAGGERFSDQHGPAGDEYDPEIGASGSGGGGKGSRGAKGTGGAAGYGPGGGDGPGGGPAGGQRGGTGSAATGGAGGGAGGGAASGSRSGAGSGTQARSGGSSQNVPGASSPTITGSDGAQSYASNGPRPGMMGPEADLSPLAETRGADWGLPDDSAQATGFTRPIRIGVFADKVVIYPERGDGRGAKTVALEGSTRNGIDDLVDSIWKEVDGWGIAGRRAYWKPVLRMEVAPDADGRYQDLEVLLRGSGIDVERKQSSR